MHDPVRTTAAWLGGRFVLLVVIVAALVVHDAYRAESSVLAAQLRGLLPDAALVERLEKGRNALANDARQAAADTNLRLKTAQSGSRADVDRRLAEVERSISERQGRRRGEAERMLALLSGSGFEQDLENEVRIHLLEAEREALRRIRAQLETQGVALRDTAQEFERARQRILRDFTAYQDRRAELARHERDNVPLAWIPGTAPWRHGQALRAEVSRLAGDSNRSAEDYVAARDRWRKARAAAALERAIVDPPVEQLLKPLDELILAKRDTLQSAERQLAKIKASASKVFLAALGWLVALTLMPVAIKAFWYWAVAPAAARRPPIRLRPRPGRAPGNDVDSTMAQPTQSAGSAVSLPVAIGAGEELLVHADFLQSSSDRGRKDTKWLLDWRYPFTSVAAGMVALTRIRASSAESYVVSSKTDPFAEVGAITVADGSALVLQPRNLVGVVQRIDRPIRIESRWRLFSLGAWITWQFRFLLFHGPCTLVVQGCRGVRIEPAGAGRSIDQAATIGFSAHLEYAPRRSETFGAYLLGMRGLFNDHFAGGPGYYVYEEMPYFGRKAGVTGRGLEGLTDAVLRVFGI